MEQFPLKIGSVLRCAPDDCGSRQELPPRATLTGGRLASLTAGLLALSMFLFAPDVRTQTPNRVERLEQIATLIRENKIQDAEKQLVVLLRRAPGEAGALNLLGTIRARQARLNEAEILFLRAIRNDKQFVGARMNLAYLYVLKHTPEKAIAQLQEVLRLQPDQADALEKLPELLLATGRVDEAIAFLEKQRLARTIPAAQLVLLGDAYLAKGDSNRAEESFLLALDGRIENAGALLGLAQISLSQGETREAMLSLARVSSLISNSESPDFLYKFALIAIKAGLANEATSALERAVKLRPDEPSFILALGIAQLRQGDLFGAEKIFRHLVEIKPDSTQGQLHLGYVLLNQKKYTEARAWLEKSARSPQPVPEVFYYLGLVAQEQNDDAGAIQLFEKSVQKLPSYVHARVALGASYIKLRNYARARQELETAVKLDPDEPKAHYNLALLYARLKDPERAQEEMRIVERLKNKGAADGGVIVLPPATPRP